MNQTSKHQPLNQWWKCIKESLGFELASHSQGIMLNFWAVEVGPKPSFLFDYGFVTTQMITGLLCSLESVKLIRKSSLRIMALGSDILVYNPAAMKTHLQKVLVNSNVKFVDVSKGKVKPEIIGDRMVLSDVLDYLKSFLDNLDNSAEFSCIPLPPMINLTTLFGVFLGYPVVYWYQISEAGMDNNLSMEPLRTYRVSGCPENSAALLNSSSGKKLVNFSDDNAHEIFSFSVPETVVHYISKDVNLWFKELQSETSWRLVFKCLKLHEFITTLAAVAL